VEISTKTCDRNAGGVMTGALAEPADVATPAGAPRYARATPGSHRPTVSELKGDRACKARSCRSDSFGLDVLGVGLA